MAKLTLKKAATDVTVYLFAQDSSKTTGVGLTGLAYNTASLTAYYVRPLGSATAITLATQTVTGAHSDGGFVEVDATNMPGVYRLDLPDAVCATGVPSAVVMLKGATNLAPVLLEIQLTDFDLNTAAVTAAGIADAVWDEAIADHTSVGSFGAKNQKVVPSETINDYKADVSGLATTTALSTVSGLVDDLESRLTAARAGYLDNLNTGVALTAAGVDAILDEAVVGSYTLRQLLKVMAAALAGKATGGGTTSVTFRGVDDTSDVIVATVDANGNRSAVTLTV